MTVKDLTSKIENGTCHIILVNANNGEVILKTIWHSKIPSEQLYRRVLNVRVTDYTLTLEVA